MVSCQTTHGPRGRTRGWQLLNRYLLEPEEVGVGWQPNSGRLSAIPRRRETRTGCLVVMRAAFLNWHHIYKLVVLLVVMASERPFTGLFTFCI